MCLSIYMHNNQEIHMINACLKLLLQISYLASCNWLALVTCFHSSGSSLNNCHKILLHSSAIREFQPHCFVRQGYLLGIGLVI